MKKKRRAVKKSSSRIIIIVLFVAIGIFIINWGKTSVEKIINPIEYYEEVMEAAQEYELDPALILAVIKTESKFDPNAVSRSDAMGLMQITKETYFFVNDKDKRGDLPVENLFDPKVNIDTGCYFLKWLIDDFGNKDTALAAYNAGRANVKKWLDNPDYSKDGETLYDIPFSETKNYVKKVNGAYENYKSLYFNET